MGGRDGFERAVRQIDDWIGETGVPGAAAVVWHRGDIVAERYAGDASPGSPVDERTLFALASVTKPITAAVVLSCVEDGLFSLDEPVARIVPGFETNADAAVATHDAAREERRAEVTVRQILSHTSGLPEDLPTGYLRLDTTTSLAAYTDAMIRQPLSYDPGTALLYSNAGYALASRVVETATGLDFWDEADRRILTPLGGYDIVARPGPRLDDRIAIVADAARAGTPAESYNSRHWRDIAIPWGGAYGSARDLVRFASTFLPSGPRLLTPGSVREMTTDQALGVAGGVQSLRTHWERAWWGLGWEVRGDKRRHWTGDLASPDTFCHFGAAGTLLWADPTRDLAAAIFASRATLRLWPFNPPRWARIGNAIAAAADLA
jgi:beta-lactamase class C